MKKQKRADCDALHSLLVSGFVYSSRSTCIGSTCAARSAGTREASAAIANTSNTTKKKVSASAVDTPYNMPDSTRANTAARHKPATHPMHDTQRPLSRKRVT